MTQAQDILDRLNEMKSALDKHIAVGVESERKINEMYITLITGNGVPSIKERVNGLEKNMLDKKTVTELEGKIDKLELRLPDPKEWSEIKLWSFWSKVILTALSIIMTGALAAMGQALFRLLAGS